ncbi:hypothetical protein [Natrinema halophilum]|uniref:Uncharacterized protein n=1 Tax=Natrinema halophilum TaxID=1699371 RepID=A0A7D5GFX5_9EURY|nr:hypothetical protein [Natrinema halophilum]QLG47907.1 hypothetical protein HYG82_03125 [Natrinema halophilum]
MTDDPTVVSRALRVFREAGAPSEESTDRNGAFSYHAETHAAGVGIGVGAAAGATGDYRIVGAIVALAFGLNRGPSLSSARIGEDIKQEPHYALGGLALGLLIGTFV